MVLAANVADALHRLSLEQYHRMIEAGVLGEDDRVELLEGMIVDMPPPEGPPHAGAIQVLNRLFTRAAGERYWVRVQSPLTLPLTASELEPDLALVDGSHDPHAAHPTTAALVIEVASTSLSRDRLWKAAIYARASIPEYWIVNVVARTIEVHRDPDPAEARYGTITTHGCGDRVHPLGLPELAVDVSAIIG